MKNKEVKKDNTKISKEEIERREILNKADEIKGEQIKLDLFAGTVSLENEAKLLLGTAIDDPEKKHKLYYDGLEKILKKFLPKDKQGKEISRMIRDEKLVFLNRGAARGPDGLRGSDSRMAHIEDIETAIDLVGDWLSQKGTYTDLYMAFYNLNESLGYGHQE